MNKIPFYSMIGWSLIVAFGIVGIVMSHPLGVQIIVITACTWVISRILFEAIIAYKILTSKDPPTKE